MKTLRNIILTLIFISASMFAQAQDSIHVDTTYNEGTVTVTVVSEISDPTVSVEQAINKAILESLKSIGSSSINSRAITAASTAIKAILADKNASAKGSFNFSFQIVANDNDANDVTVKTTLEAGGEKYSSDTNSKYDPAAGTTSTTGNVTGPNGTSSVNLGTDSSGNVTGSVGDGGVSSPASENGAGSITQPTSDQTSGNEGGAPDNTITTSGSK